MYLPGQYLHTYECVFPCIHAFENHTYSHTCIRKHIHMWHTRLRLNIFTSKSMHMCIHTRSHTHTHAYIKVCTHSCKAFDFPALPLPIRKVSVSNPVTPTFYRVLSRCHYWVTISVCLRGRYKYLATCWKVRGSNPFMGRYFPHPFGLVLGPNQPPVRWVLGLFMGSKAAGAWCWPLTSV